MSSRERRTPEAEAAAAKQTVKTPCTSIADARRRFSKDEYEGEGKETVQSLQPGGSQQPEVPCGRAHTKLGTSRQVRGEQMRKCTLRAVDPERLTAPATARLRLIPEKRASGSTTILSKAEPAVRDRAKPTRLRHSPNRSISISACSRGRRLHSLFVCFRQSDHRGYRTFSSGAVVT